MKRFSFDWRQFFARLLLLLKSFLGDFEYKPPTWIGRARERVANSRLGQWIHRKSAALVRVLASRVRANPRRSRQIALGTIGSFVVIAIAYYGIRQYLDSLPKPDYVTVSLTAPGEPDLETGANSPLQVTFSKSAAKMQDLDKPVVDAVKLKPEIKGTWRWTSDSQLTFMPAEPWQIARKYSVALTRKLFPDHVLLENLDYEFETPQVQGKITKSEFYQDPRDPNIKKVVLNLHYNYAVDTEDFKKRVSMSLQSKDESVLKERPQKIGFSVSFNAKQNEVYIISEAIPIPKKDSLAKVEIASGVRSTRGGASAEAVEDSVEVPGIFERFKFEEASVTFARNEKFEPEQILILSTKAELPTESLGKSLKLWLLPKYRSGEEKLGYFSRWNSASEVTPQVRKQLEPLKFKVVPAEEENSFKHTFKIDVPVGRYVLVEVQKGLKSYGGYELMTNYGTIVDFPDYPKELMIMSQGALLSLSGDKKIPLLGRNIQKATFKLYRILPTQLNQFIYNNYRHNPDYANPHFNNIDPNSLSEIFTKEINVSFRSAAKTQYFSLDLEPYLNKENGSKKGLFYVSVEGVNAGVSDRRLILLTDLGVIVKETNDKGHSVFVQNLHTGAPVSDAQIEIMGTNGLPVLVQKTGPDGRANFPDLSDFKNERKPIAFIVKKDGDLSFLPYRMIGRNLTYSQFDIGGIHENPEKDQLTAFLFSDRGIYRPGDTVNMGMMVRARNWKKSFAKLPISWTVSDARGTQIFKEKLEVGSGDISSLSFPTQDTGATGVYNIQAFITQADRADEQIGSLSIRVEEFLPDRMRISANILGAKPKGWVAPQGVKGLVSLKNLFGTPAEDRKIRGEIVVSPVHPFFKEYKDFEFTVVRKDQKSFSETLEEKTTDAKGEAEFDLDLSRFTSGMYELRFNAEGYEASGGRAVSATQATLVSAEPFLVGVKLDGSLSYMPKASEHKIHLIAVDSDLKPVSANNLATVIIEKRYVSALMQQPDGTYKYHSVLKEIPQEPKPLTISGSGVDFKLPSAVPGDFVLLIKDKSGAELNRVAFSVAGEANLSRSLEKNAELQVTLNRQDYKPGDEIEMQIKAPYTGAGLITIERDKVYAVKWFKTSTTSAIEKIKIPEGVEGNAFINVTFLRAIDSKEIFMSPLSYAVLPFSISLDEHKIALRLDVPSMVKPGEKLKIGYSASRKTKVILYGVDEGILQVAKYKLPDPLSYFFQNRALQVKTFQLLDLLLPEYSVLQSLSAAGGDEGAARLAHNLNPFKRKSDKPVVFWSGVIDAGPEKREYEYEVPDYFNGNIKVMAVATNGPAFGTSEQGVVSRGDFIISPNLPMFVAPGDEVEVGVGLANQAEGSGENAQVKLELSSDAFEIIGEHLATLKVPEGHESSTSFILKAKKKLGSQAIRFKASAGGKSAKASVETSIRPAVPYMTDLIGGPAPKASFEEPVVRHLLPEYRKQTAALSPVPSVFTGGLTAFLDSYPYGCSEQLTSKVFPHIVLKSRPEFKIDPRSANTMFNSTLATLRTRQTSDGGFAMYDAHQGTNLAATLYVTHMLIEAKERGFAVPDDVLQKSLQYLESESVRETSTMDRAREFAYALYLQARAGRVPGNDLAFLHKALITNHKDEWAQDLTAGWLAATYRLVKKDDEARKIFSKLKIGAEVSVNYEYFYDGFVRDTALIYLAARHFPETLKDLASDAAMKQAFAPLAHSQYNTHSAAFSILALDAVFAAAAKPASLNALSIVEVLEKGVTRPLSLPSGSVIPSVTFSEAAVKVRYGVPENLPFYYLQTQAGYDSELPREVIKKNLEVTREYLDKNDKPVTSAKMGDELKVRLRLRANGKNPISQIVLVDLLSSGLEAILEPITVASESETVYQGNLPGKKKKRHYDEDAGEAQESEPSSEDAPEQPVEDQPETEGEGAMLRMFRVLLPEAIAEEAARTVASVAGMQTDYVDRREDRMVIYATATQDVTEYVYRVKAVAKGKFVVPPAFAESMYDRGVQFRGLSSTFTVEAP